MRHHGWTSVLLMAVLGSCTPVWAADCSASIDNVRSALGLVLMMAHETTVSAPDGARPDGQAKRLAASYMDAKRSLATARIDCAGDQRAMDSIRALDLDMEKIGATLNPKASQ